MSNEEKPSLQVDSDWKAQAQAEKERLAKAAAQKKASASATAGAAGAGAAAGAASEGPGGPGGPGGQQIPEASFEVLISTMATQALFALGGIPDPRTGQRMAHLGLARHHIDLLSVLQEKTEGNLSDEEKNMLNQTLYELRQRYIQLSTQERNG
ncbi:MAG: hypothetical protein CMJ19_09200 [Phycisphaeraceae bacterium]|nr:hypothetical protein [Phycisphaeraceae bacterium]